MALRENDALRAAVMIFFMLVVVLAVTTYLFFKYYDDQKKKVAQLEKEVATTATLAREDLDTINELKRLIGYSAEDNLETIKAQFQKDMDTYGQTFPEESRFYRPILDSMHRELQVVEKDGAEALATVQELTARLEVLEKTKDQQIDTFKESMQKIASDVEAERKKNAGERQRITQTNEKLAADLTALRNESVTTQEKYQDREKTLVTRIDTLSHLRQAMEEKLNSLNVKGHEHPQGRVTWVNQRSNVVWINLGSRDSLKRQTNFAVYPVDSNGLALDEKKGSIEVTRILDDGMAEARIVQDDPVNPILPGDKIHSSVWRPGQPDSFALVGFMDINGDDRSDRDQIRDVIALNGGKIDMELLDNGEVQGKITLGTRYLVLGTPPEATEKNNRAIELFSRAQDEARELGVETISVDRFVDQMGWHPDNRTVQLGRGAKSKDFRARFPVGAQRPPYGSTSTDFQPRKRPLSTF